MNVQECEQKPKLMEPTRMANEVAETKHRRSSPSEIVETDCDACWHMGAREGNELQGGFSAIEKKDGTME
jgi:hypothetical protein